MPKSFWQHQKFDKNVDLGKTGCHQISEQNELYVQINYTVATSRIAASHCQHTKNEKNKIH